MINKRYTKLGVCFIVVVLVLLVNYDAHMGARYSSRMFTKKDCKYIMPPNYKIVKTSNNEFAVAAGVRVDTFIEEKGISRYKIYYDFNHEIYLQRTLAFDNIFITYDGIKNATTFLDSCQAIGFLKEMMNQGFMPFKYN